MIPCPDTDRLRQLLNETQSPEDYCDLQEHLGACPRCWAAVEALTAVELRGSGAAAILSYVHALRWRPEAPSPVPGHQLPQPEPVAGRPKEALAPLPFQEQQTLASGQISDGTDVSETGTPLPAVQIPGYEIVKELGRGGMGVVYLARQTRLGRLVALKMVLAGSHARSDDLQRFQTEAEAVARLQHPNIVQVFEIGEHEGRPFFSMEFCPGGSLDRKLAGSPLPSEEAARLVETLAAAVQAAHQANVVHRDLKPANVLLAADGTAKITDFGLAKKLDEASQTQTGSVMGTPSYMAPEQAEGKKAVGPAVDVYALGAILYECQTGRPPFKAATLYDTMMQVMTQQPVSPRQLNAKVPLDLETISLKCLEKDPARRYGSAREVAEDLQRFWAGEPIRARPVGSLERAWRWGRRNRVVAGSLLLVVVSLLAASVVSVWFGLRAEQARQAEANRAISEATAKQEADRARRDAQRQLIDLSAASGLTANREGDDSLALLWFARAVQLAKDEPEMQELNRIRFGNWRRQVSLPEGTFTVPAFRQAQDRFRTFAFSPDGKYLLVITSNGACLVWDRLQRQLVELPSWAVQSPAAAWVPGSSLLAIAGKERPIQFLKPPAFQPTGEEVVPDEKVTVLAFSRDGKRLAWGGGASARVWERDKKEYATPLLTHGGAVASLSFSAGGDMLATSARDGKVRVFRSAAEEQQPLFPPINAEVVGVNGSNHGGTDQVGPRFTPDDQILLIVQRTRQGNQALAWRSAKTGRFVGATDLRQSFLNSFAVSPQGNHVAAFWWDLSGGRLLDTRSRGILAAIPGWGCEDIAFTADGKSLVTGGLDSVARFWSVDDRPNYSLTPSFPSILHPTQVVRVSLTSDGRHLATALWDGRICLWRLPEGVPVAYSVPVGGATLLALSPDRRFVLPRGTSYMNGTLLDTRVYQAESGEAAGPKLDPGGILLDAGFSPDGTKVVTASSTAKTPHERSTNGHGFKPDGQAGSVQIWDWKTGKRLAGPIATPTEPRGLAFRPDGRTLAVVCADYQVLLINPDTGAITHRLDPGMRSRPWLANLWWSNGEARFSPDGRFLVTWELAKTVHVWDPDSGKQLHSLPHNDRIEQVCFNPRLPNLLATGGRDAVVRVWDLSNGKLCGELQHPGWSRLVHFSPDGTELVTTASDMVRAWDWRAGKLKEGVSASLARFTSDRRWLVAFCSQEAGGGSRIQVIDWQTKTPASPGWKLIGGPNLDICILAGDRRAIVTGFSGSLVGYDLEKIVTPAPGPTEDLVLLAELAAGRRILSQGNVVPLSSIEWADRWQRFRRKGDLLQPETPSASSDH